MQTNRREITEFKHRYIRRINETNTRSYSIQELKQLRYHMDRPINTTALRMAYCEKLLGTSWVHVVSTLPSGWMDKTIDHVIPIDRYDLNNETDLFKCFNFQNLQVVTMPENRAKGVDIIPKTKHMQAPWSAAWNDKWIGTTTGLSWRPIVSI